MNYEIKYELSGDAKRISAAKKWMKIATFGLAGVCIISAIIWSFDGNWALTATALEDMAANLGDGMGIREAFSEFCLEILEGA